MHTDALRDLLIHWCNQNSGSTHYAGLERMRELLAQEFATLAEAKVETVPLAGTTAKALRINIRPEAPQQVLLSGHYDTVYDADHPFQKCEITGNDILRGPGVADMKGGLVVMLAALRQFETDSSAHKLGFELLLTPDEEISSTASEPIIAETARRHRLALVFEPARANGDLVKSRMGTGSFSITVHGRAAHAGNNPEDGRNAILALGELLPKVDELQNSIPESTVNIGRISGGGAINIVPDEATVVINARVTHNGDDEVFIQKLTDVITPLNQREGFRTEISGSFDRKPKVETEAEIALFTAWQHCAHELGISAGWQHVGGGSDGNLFSAAGLTNLDGLGPVGGKLHSDQEYIHISSLAERAQIIARLLAKIATGDIPLP